MAMKPPFIKGAAAMATRVVPLDEDMSRKGGWCDSHWERVPIEAANTPHTAIETNRLNEEQKAMKLYPYIALTAALAVLPVRAQEFEVVSIRLNRGGGAISKANLSHGRFTASNLSVRDLIRFAFHVQEFEIFGGPGWMGTEKYDIAGKTAAAADTDVQFQPPLQALLADRFQLKFHRETRKITAYLLVVAKSGPKPTAHASGGEFSTDSSAAGLKAHIIQNATPANLADSLTRNLGREVVDRTGRPESSIFTWNGAPIRVTDSPSIFTALQEQTGLRLEPTKIPAEAIVVDSVERPSEN